MPWSRSRPGSHPRYQTRQHREDVKQAKAALARVGSGLCAERVCVFPTRVILPGMKLHLSHDRTTGVVLGLSHMRCNLSEAGRYARALQNVTRIRL